MTVTVLLNPVSGTEAILTAVLALVLSKAWMSTRRALVHFRAAGDSRTYVCILMSRE